MHEHRYIFGKIVDSNDWKSIAICECIYIRGPNTTNPLSHPSSLVQFSLWDFFFTYVFLIFGIRYFSMHSEKWIFITTITTLNFFVVMKIWNLGWTAFRQWKIVITTIYMVMRIIYILQSLKSRLDFWYFSQCDRKHLLPQAAEIKIFKKPVSTSTCTHESTRSTRVLMRVHVVCENILSVIENRKIFFNSNY